MPPESAPVRVMIVISNLTFGGAERQVVEIANHLDSEDFEVYVCILSDHAPLADRMQQPNRLYKLPKQGKYDFSVVFKLSRLIKQLNIDVVHGFLFDAEIASRLASRLAGVPVFGSERNSSYQYPTVHKWLYRLTNWMTVACIANSKAGMEQNQAVFGRPDNQYRVIYNGVDTERFKPRQKDWSRLGVPQPEAKFVLGMVGSFKPQKNHFYLLDIIKALSLQRKDFVLLIAGTMIFEGNDESKNYFDAVKARIAELELQDYVQLVGAISDVENFYAVCDVTLLASKHEGTPNVALESMACGVPVVATDVADNSYVIPDGKVGFVRPLDDAKGFAKSIDDYLSSEVARADMPKQAVRWIAESFSNEQMVSQFAATYRSTVGDGRAT